MAAQFIGSWKLTASENFDEFLKAMNVGMITRTMAKSTTPTVNISQEGDKYKLETVTKIKTSVIEFKLNEEFTEARLDGQTVKCMMTLEGDKLVQVQHSDPVVTIKRWIDGTDLHVEAECKGVVSVRKYAKQ